MLQAVHLPNSSFEATFKSGDFEASISPADIRVLAAKLVECNRLPDAAELVAEGLKEYPDSEDLLVMQALVSEVQQDWPAASKALEKLVNVQGTKTTLETWRHWVRVLRCAGQAEQAHQVTLKALKQAPRDSLLISELAALQGLLGRKTSYKAAA